MFTWEGLGTPSSANKLSTDSGQILQITIGLEIILLLLMPRILDIHGQMVHTNRLLCKTRLWINLNVDCSYQGEDTLPYVGADDDPTFTNYLNGKIVESDTTSQSRSLTKLYYSPR